MDFIFIILFKPKDLIFKIQKKKKKDKKRMVSLKIKSKVLILFIPTFNVIEPVV